MVTSEPKGEINWLSGRWSVETCRELEAKRSASCGEDADLAAEPHEALLGFLFLFQLFLPPLPGVYFIPQHFGNVWFVGSDGHV